MSARTGLTAFARDVVRMTYDYGMSVNAIAEKTKTSADVVRRSLAITWRKYPELCRKGGSGSAAEEFERNCLSHPREPMEKGFSSEATSPAAVVECLKTGMTAEATARHLGIRQSVVESTAAQVHDLGRQPQALLGAWRTGSTLKDLSDKYSMTVFDIWRAIDREILNGCIRDSRGVSKLTYSDVQALCNRHPSAVTVMMQEHNASRPEAEERVALARDYNKSVRSKRDSAKADKRQRNLILSESASPLFTAKEQRMLKYFDDGLWTSDIAERMQMNGNDVFDTLCGLIRRRDALLQPLTPIELKILDRWDKGMSTADIAANLHLEVAGLQTLIVTLLRQRRALADAKPSDTGDTRTIAERTFDHDITALNKSIKDTAQEVRVMIRGAALEGRPEVKTEFTTGIPRFGGGEASTTSAEGDTNMSELTYNRAKVIETGKANLGAHTKALAAATEAAAAAIKAYMEKVAPALVRGEQPEAKAPEIKVIADQTKTYEKHLRQLEHLSGDTVPSTAAVDFLLKDPEEVNRGVETEITLGVVYQDLREAPAPARTPERRHRALDGGRGLPAEGPGRGQPRRRD